MEADELYDELIKLKTTVKAIEEIIKEKKEIK
jgi:hypothetical protein